MGWWIKRSNLSEEQRLSIHSIKNNLGHVHWVKGAAGTGKTTVLAALTQELRLEHADSSFCYLTYTHALKDLAINAFKEEGVENVHFLTHTKFLQNNWRCDFAFLDEVQDISVEDLNTIKKLAKHLIIAGDCSQSIYEHSPSEEQIKQNVQPFQHILIIIHRLTESLAKIASSILPSKDLLGAKPGNTLADTTARLMSFDNQTKEFIWVAEEALTRARPDKPSCILFSHHKEISTFIEEIIQHLTTDNANQIFSKQTNRKDRYNYAQVNNYFKENNINLRYLGNDYGDLDEISTKPISYIMTYHSSKGLDFENVFIPQMNKNKEIVYDFVLAKEGNIDLDKRLLFVAVTRSRCNLFFSFHDTEPHPLIKNLPNLTQVQSQPNHLNNDEDEDIF